MKTKRQAIAEFLGMDTNEVEEYRYHHGLTSQPVYAIDSKYYCVSRGTQKAATHRNGIAWNWIEIKDAHCNSFNYRIFEAQ